MGAVAPLRRAREHSLGVVRPLRLVSDPSPSAAVAPFDWAGESVDPWAPVVLSRRSAGSIASLLRPSTGPIPRAVVQAIELLSGGA